MIVLWFVLQLFSGLGSLGVEGGGTAWWAHVGGFVVGFALVRVFVQKGFRPPPSGRPRSEIGRRADWQ